MNKNKTSTCCTCGYTWQTGTNGRHSCSEALAKKVDILEQAIRTYVRKEMRICNLRSDDEVVQHFINVVNRLDP